jgi:hypothetical protein
LPPEPSCVRPSLDTITDADWQQSRGGADQDQVAIIRSRLLDNTEYEIHALEVWRQLEVLPKTSLCRPTRRVAWLSTEQTSSMAAENGSNRIAPRRPQSPNIDRLTCMNDLYRPARH